MEPDSQITRTQLAELQERLTAIERRLAVVERGSSSIEVAENAPVVATPRTAVKKADRRTLPELLPIIGQTVLIIGGAFVLRAITEAGWLGLAAGAATGIAYAVVWIGLAHRVAAGGRPLEATFYGTAATIIAYPLLWETTVVFEFLATPATATVLLGFTLFALVVVWRDRLHGLSWVVTLGGGATAIALAVATRQLPLFLGVLLLIGLGTLWIGWSREWPGLAWAIAVPANAGVLLMTLIVVRMHADSAATTFEPWTVVGIQVALVVVYLGSLVVRTLTTHRELGILEIALGVMATVVGLGGAIVLVRVTGVAAGALGALALTMAVGSYAASFTLIDRGQTQRTNFVFYSTLALACTLVGFETLVGGVALTLAMALAAIVAAWAGGHWERATLSGHGAVYVVGASLTSGMLGLAVAAFGSSDPPRAGSLGPAIWIALAVAVGCTTFRVATHGRTWGRLSGFPKLTFITVALIGVDVLAVSLLVPVVMRGTDPGRDAAILAVLRTAVLAVSAVGLAWLGGWERYREARWMVYPVILVAAIKLLLEDFRTGSPATLVLSLALFGGALILAPRMASRMASRPRTGA